VWRVGLRADRGRSALLFAAATRCLSAVLVRPKPRQKSTKNAKTVFIPRAPRGGAGTRRPTHTPPCRAPLGPWPRGI